MSEEKKSKIIVDDDWKEQVEKEKAAMAAGEVEGEPSDAVSESSTAEDTAKESADQDPITKRSGEEGFDDSAPPPASFEVLISMMFTQGMAMLGHIPNPETGQASVNKPYAKHTIDTLEVLVEKTKGNLTDDESKMLSEAMHALRMAYVGVQG